MLSSSFSFWDFTFYNEALCFVVFILSLCSNTTLENIFEYIHQKFLKKYAHFKILSRDEFFTRFFFLFFIPGWNFIPVFRDEFIPGWNFISTKTCKQWETFHHRQGWFHPGTSYIPGRNIPCKHPLSDVCEYCWLGQP